MQTSSGGVDSKRLFVAVTDGPNSNEAAVMLSLVSVAFLNCPGKIFFLILYTLNWTLVMRRRRTRRKSRPPALSIQLLPFSDLFLNGVGE